MKTAAEVLLGGGLLAVPVAYVTHLVRTGLRGRVTETDRLENEFDWRVTRVLMLLAVSLVVVGLILRTALALTS